MRQIHILHKTILGMELLLVYQQVCNKTTLLDVPQIGYAGSNNIEFVYFITVQENQESNIAKRKASLVSKLPHDMLLSPDVLEVSTVIGQGETILKDLLS